MTQEREHPRYAHAAAVTLLARGKTIQGRTQNVSRGGLCADLSDAVAVGTELEVALQLVFENEEHSEPLRIPARVVWCTTVDEGFQIGIAFKPLTNELGKLVTLFLSYLDDAGPKTKTPKSERSIDDQFG